MSALEQKLIDALRETRTRVHELERMVSRADNDYDEACMDADYYRKLCEENDIATD